MYEAMLQAFGTDYKDIEHKNVRDENVFTEFFGASPSVATFDNAQRVDFDGLIGRLNSASYMPGRDDPRHAAMANRAQEIFSAHQQNGMVAFEYSTRVFYGGMV